MSDPLQRLAAFQQADSFFPSGVVSFSWGLETLCGSGRVQDSADVAAFVSGQLQGRWASFDRAALVASYRAADDHDGVTEVDQLVEAATLSLEMREGSRHSGMALLSVHDRLATPGAADYKARVLSGVAPGHATPVQGLLWRARDITEDDAVLISAHGLCISLIGAALRLGVIGHVDAQKILASVHPDIVAILRCPPPPLLGLRAFVPEAEIAVMRHENESARLFAN